MASFLTSARNRWGAFASAVLPGYGSLYFAPPTVKEPSRKLLQTPEAFVDPSRLVTGWKQSAYNPSWLVTRKGLQIYDQMKRDEQVKAALKFKKDSVLSSGWEVTSPGDEDEDWEVSRFVRDTFDQFPGGWNAVLVNVMSALDFGYSACEKIYEEKEQGEWKGKLVLNRVQPLKPHFIDFVSDEFGVLQAIEQQNVGREAGLMPPAKFVIYTHAAEFGNYYGVSDLEAAYRPWWVKDNSYKWLAVSLERYGMAPLFAMYNPNSYTGTMVDELKKVVKGIQNATMGVIPRAMATDLEMWSQNLDKGSGDLFLKALERFDQHIARALLVPSMIGMSADEGKTGSLARSESHQDSFMQVVSQLQIDLAASVINSRVIPQLCDLNFPNLESYPLFRFLPFTEAQRLEVLGAWAELVGGKIVNKIEDDETHIRKVLGFPENENPEVIEEEPPVMPGVGVDAEGKPIKMGADGKPLRFGPDGKPWKDPNAKPGFGGFGKKPPFGKKPNPFEKKKFEQDDSGAEGVWRTVRGRKLFIRNGEDVAGALDRSLGGGADPEIVNGAASIAKMDAVKRDDLAPWDAPGGNRKSTRLNSSH